MFSPPELSESPEAGQSPVDMPPDIPADTALPSQTFDLQANNLQGTGADEYPDMTAPASRGTEVPQRIGAPLLASVVEGAGDAADANSPPGGSEASAAQADENLSNRPEPSSSGGDAGDKPPPDSPPPAGSAPEPDDSGDKPMRWGRGEAQEAFRRAVEDLREHGVDPSALIANPVTRKIIDGFVDQGKTIEQIAAETGRPTAYITQLIGRGVEAMRRGAPQEAKHLIPQPTGRPAERFMGEGSGTQIARQARAERLAAARAGTAEKEAIPEPRPKETRPRETRERGQPPDLRDIIPAAQAGNSQAQRTLFAITDRLIAGRLRPYDTGVIDTGNVAGEVHARMVAHPFDTERPLPTDDPAKAAQVIYRRYAAYVAKTVRSVVADHFRQNREVTQGVGDSSGAPLHALEAGQTTEKHRVDITDLIPREDIEAALGSKQQLAVFDARMAGKSNAQIAAELSTVDRPVNAAAVKAMAYRVRTNLESAILEPAGLKSIHRHEQESFLRQLIKYQEIDSVRVLGMDYVKDEWIPPNLAGKGYIPLRDITTNAAATTFKYTRPDMIHRQLGRVRINPADLPHLLDIQAQKQAEHGILEPPQSGYVSLPSLIRTPQQAVALSAAVTDGTFTNIIRTRQALFVREDQARYVLEALQHHRAL